LNPQLKEKKKKGGGREVSYHLKERTWKGWRKKGILKGRKDNSVASRKGHRPPKRQKPDKTGKEKKKGLSSVLVHGDGKKKKGGGIGLGEHVREKEKRDIAVKWKERDVILI